MSKQHYTSSISVNSIAKEVFQRITRVSEWWSENIEGNTKNLNDIFTIRFVFGDSFVMKIVEIVPEKKIVWQVIDCNLTWVKDPQEWKGTHIHFDIAGKKNSVQVTFTHIGLVPEIECYKGCVGGWNQYISESLLQFLTDGKGKPDRKK